LRNNIRILLLTLSIGILLMGVKFLAWYITGSNAILTDALESIINVTAGFFALICLVFAHKPTDRDHPYGHGKIEFLSAGFEGGLVFLAGAYVIGKSVYNFFIPREIHDLDFGIYLTLFSGAANFVMGRILVSKGKKHHSSLMTANGKHLITDTISSAGLVIGLLLIHLTGLNWMDNAVAIVFGLYILYEGYHILKDSVVHLLDEADETKLQLIINSLNKHRKTVWIDVHNLRLLKFGSRYHIDAHVTLPWYMSLEESHSQIQHIESIISSDFENEMEFFFHSDPCIPAKSCRICRISDCLHRKTQNEETINWTLNNVLPDKKHE
jgi:cation diffusion facilitator family transporter